MPETNHRQNSKSSRRSKKNSKSSRRSNKTKKSSKKIRRRKSNFYKSAAVGALAAVGAVGALAAVGAGSAYAYKKYREYKYTKIRREEIFEKVLKVKEDVFEITKKKIIIYGVRHGNAKHIKDYILANKNEFKHKITTKILEYITNFTSSNTIIDKKLPELEQMLKNETSVQQKQNILRSMFLLNFVNYCHECINLIDRVEVKNLSSDLEVIGESDEVIKEGSIVLLCAEKGGRYEMWENVDYPKDRDKISLLKHWGNILVPIGHNMMITRLALYRIPLGIVYIGQDNNIILNNYRLLSVKLENQNLPKLMGYAVIDDTDNKLTIDKNNRQKFFDIILSSIMYNIKECEKLTFEKIKEIESLKNYEYSRNDITKIFLPTDEEIKAFYYYSP